MELTYVNGQIVKTEKTDDGLVVFGKATGPDLDIDKQICDPSWLERAMPAWMEWGNVREGHTNLAAGVGLELEQAGGDWNLKSLCVDPTTQKKIETKVLKGYSIGIKGARVVKDDAAPGGRIVDGEIVEISYVDRPANPTAKITIAKSAGDGDGLGPVAGGHVNYNGLHGHAHDHGDGDGPHEHPHAHTDDNVHDHGHDQVGDNATAKGADPDLGKADRSTADTNDLPDSAFAYIEPGGTKDDSGKTVPRSNRHFPIDDAAHVRNALARAPQSPFGDKAMPKIKSAAAKFGIDVAKVATLISKGAAVTEWLGAGDLTKDVGDDESSDINGAQEAIAAIAKLIQSEADGLAAGDLGEAYDIQCLLEAVQSLKYFACREQAETQGDTMDYAVLGVSADIVKAAAAADATDENKSALKAELVKQLGIADIVKEALGDVPAVLAAVKEDLETVKEMAAPADIRRTRSQAAAEKSARVEQLEAEAERFRHLATQVTDPDLAVGYRAKAAEADQARAALLQ